jgi:DNA-directed RNA polymerase specialized sigma24 family protein
LEKPAAWIKHAAINRIRHQRRGQGRMGTEPSRLVDRDEMTATSDEGLDVLPALAGLPRQQRAVVALYYLLDQATSAIADTLDITEATVREVVPAIVEVEVAVPRLRPACW